MVFHFKTADNRELPMILGEVPVLPEHWWKGRDFEAPLTDAPVGSGPYRSSGWSWARRSCCSGVPDWWAADLPTGRGLNNFDTIRYEYFRDPTVAFEAFKAGQVDFRQENSAKNWATAYDFPAVTKGLVKLETLPHRLPTGMQGFAMNTRREVFKDRRVRQAMDEVFDFEWMNKNLFYGKYTRTDSYFSNSEFASSGVPQGPSWRCWSRSAPSCRPSCSPAVHAAGDRRVRQQPRRAAPRAGPAEAGRLDGARPQAGERGRQQMSFEILLNEPAFERVGLPYAQWLGRLGIDVHVRTVDAAQFQKRMDDLDFDMAVAWSRRASRSATSRSTSGPAPAPSEKGTQNYAGVCDPAVDALVAPWSAPGRMTTW